MFGVPLLVGPASRPPARRGLTRAAAAGGALTSTLVVYAEANLNAKVAAQRLWRRRRSKGPAGRRSLEVMHVRRLYGAALRRLGARTSARARAAQDGRWFEGMFMDVAIGMALVDADGHWIRANPALTTMLGYAEEELIGQRFTDITHPDDVDDGVRRVEGLRNAPDRVEQYEKRYITADGRVIWALVTVCQLTRWQAGLGFLVAQIQDITASKRAQQELRESEERWRTLVANSQEIVMLVDHRGLLTYASPSVERWLGYDPATLIGTTLDPAGESADGSTLTSHPDDAHVLAQALSDLPQATHASQPMALTHRVRHHDGSWHTLESVVGSRTRSTRRCSSPATPSRFSRTRSRNC